MVKTKKDEENFFAQVANKLKGFEKLQQDNHEIYSRPSERLGDSNGNESDQDILDNHIKSWDLESPGISSPVPPIPVRRPINSLDCTNNNTPPPPNRSLNPYATMPRRSPAAPPILPPKPTNEDKTIVIYKMVKEEIPTRIRLQGKCPTLKKLKETIMKKGDFRYFCKIAVKNGLNVFQEILEDGEVLPQFEDKINCQVAEADKDCFLTRINGMKVEVEYPMQKAIYQFYVLRTPSLREFKSCLPVVGNYR